MACPRVDNGHEHQVRGSLHGGISRHLGPLEFKEGAAAAWAKLILFLHEFPDISQEIRAVHVTFVIGRDTFGHAGTGRVRI